jgi:hypothetical protein
MKKKPLQILEFNTVVRAVTAFVVARDFTAFGI